MAARVSPTERIRADIDELFATEGDLGEVLEQVARLGARLLLQSALETEVTEFLGRNRYERRALTRQARAGSRNGFESPWVCWRLHRLERKMVDPSTDRIVNQYDTEESAVDIAAANGSIWLATTTDSVAEVQE